jgi:hypothetical protein
MTTLRQPKNAHMSTTTVQDDRSGLVVSSVARKALAVVRIAFGLTFLWAFFDKLLGLGFSTGADTNAAGAKTGIDFFSKDAWIHGGNPTLGFLKFERPVPSRASTTASTVTPGSTGPSCWACSLSASP